MRDLSVEKFIVDWRDTGGSELANTQSFINGLCSIVGVAPPNGSRSADALNDYVFERGVFQDNGDGTTSFGRIDVYKRDAFVLEAKQGSDQDRAAEAEGRLDLDLFGQTAAQRVKRGTARRGTPSWAKAMLQAKGQAERYAKALPPDHGWPPFIMVADVGYCLEVYADFSRSGKSYVQFPDRGSYRIMLDDLRDAAVRERLRAIWAEPLSLDPTSVAAAATKEVAALLATVARRLEERGHAPEIVSAFLMRVLFTMFAEDTRLIPERSFTSLLERMREHPEHAHNQLSALWVAMDAGKFAPALGIPVRRFNGYLFKEHLALPLDGAELEALVHASKAKWTDVEPAIFGTLLERALDPNERAKLGAHYTPRSYVDRLVFPAIIEPLRAEWAVVRTAAVQLLENGKADDARRQVQKFHSRLAQTRVLDPACGTGNFLYVAMARLKELEGEVVELLVDLGDKQYVAELSGHTITPENFVGVETNPRAAAIAQLVLWIGYLQWHFRVVGRDRMPEEPILRDVRTIRNEDALIEWDSRFPQRDEHGAPVTRWDGITKRPHPITGKLVPDEAARVEVYAYVNPRAAHWPDADYVVGNPPFIGNKRMRQRLGDGYVEALRRAWPKVPSDVDLVMYWWERCADLVRQGRIRGFGLVSTNSIRQITNRAVVARHMSSDPQLSIVFAIPDHPWRDEETNAAVRVAMTVGLSGARTGTLRTVVAERRTREGTDVLFEDSVGYINSDLSTGPDTTTATVLRANSGIAFMGIIPVGLGFRIDPQREGAICRELGGTAYLRRYLGGSDLTDNKPSSLIIDVGALSEERLKSDYPLTYQHLWNEVKPHREAAERKNHRVQWWRFGEVRVEMRRALSGLSRYVATTETAKHRVFSFLDGDILPDQKIRVIARDDPYVLGILSSRIHRVWADATGGRQGAGNDPVYNHTPVSRSSRFPPIPPRSWKNASVRLPQQSTRCVSVSSPKMRR
jgi:hypothetical protein